MEQLHRPRRELQPATSGAAAGGRRSCNRQRRELQPTAGGATGGGRRSYKGHATVSDYATTSAATALRDVGTNTQLCYYRRFGLMEPTIQFSFLLPPYFSFAGTIIIICYHRCFEFVFGIWSHGKFFNFCFYRRSVLLEPASFFATTDRKSVV